MFGWAHGISSPVLLVQEPPFGRRREPMPFLRLKLPACSASFSATLASNSAASIQSGVREHPHFTMHPTQRCVSSPHGAFLYFLNSSHFFSCSVSIFHPARCSCSRVPAHHPHEEGDPHPREPPFPFRHSISSPGKRMTHTGSPSPSVMKPVETLDTVLPSSSPWWTMGVSGGEGFKFRNQFANSVHDVLQFDGGEGVTVHGSPPPAVPCPV